MASLIQRCHVISSGRTCTKWACCYMEYTGGTASDRHEMVAKLCWICLELLAYRESVDIHQLIWLEEFDGKSNYTM